MVALESRSGKTFIAIYALIIRACKEKSRHAILRYKFNHVKTSIWMDTLPKVIRIAFPEMVDKCEWNKTDYCLILPNGSEIWHSGLDDQARVEKILGKEYSTIYFNECSQIPFRSIETALTRLAEKNNLRKKAYFDENPPSKRHWSYHLWVRGIHPISGEVVDKSKYASILMNPEDNIQNIDSEYITEILDHLSDKERQRFKFGQFQDADEGSAYYSFQPEINVHAFDNKYRNGTIMAGLDFNVSPMTAVIGHYQSGIFHVFDEIYMNNSDTPKMCNELINRGYRGALVFPDSTGRNRKTSGASDFSILKENGFTIQDTRNPFVRDRVNNVNRLLRDGKIIIDPKCKKLINDLEKVTWDGNDLDKRSDSTLTHISDALGYWCWSLDSMIGPSPKTSTIQL